VQESPAGPDFVAIETPEHVTFTYEIAGLMSRSLAAIIDHLIQFVAALVLFAGFLGAMGGFAQGGLQQISMAAYALFGLAIWLLIWGYFVAFELLWRGQTPGKRLVGIRVIREGGYGVTAGSILIRNLIRVFGDLVPFPAIGLGVMFASARAKRLGDLIAGTLVVRDVAWTPPPALRIAEFQRVADANLVNDLRRAAIHRLKPEFVRTIESFLVRAEELEIASRRDIAWRLADPIARTLGLPAPDPERLLRHVVVALREEVKEA
jgi:uncharacterized RDD family membrane protein YckC